MKRLKYYDGDPTFVTVFSSSFDLISDGYYILRADMGIPLGDEESDIEDKVLINVKPEYYLFEMNDEFRHDEIANNKLKEFHRINLKHLTPEEYIEYMNLEP